MQTLPWRPQHEPGMGRGIGMALNARRDTDRDMAHIKIDPAVHVARAFILTFADCLHHDHPVRAHLPILDDLIALELGRDGGRHLFFKAAAGGQFTRAAHFGLDPAGRIIKGCGQRLFPRRGGRFAGNGRPSFAAHNAQTSLSWPMRERSRRDDQERKNKLFHGFHR